MASIINRYASAVHSSNLKVSRELDKTNETVTDDTDTLGAMALADRDLERGRRTDGTSIHPAPLAVPLERLFAGDRNAAHDIVRKLAEMLYTHSFEVRVKVARPICVDIAKACLAWHRDGVCKACGGHGYSLIPGVPALSGHTCPACRGTGKIRLSEVFAAKHLALAQWLIDEMMREAGRAGPEAMKRLSSAMDIAQNGKGAA